MRKSIVLTLVALSLTTFLITSCKKDNPLNAKKAVTPEAIENRAKEIEASIKRNQKGLKIPKQVKDNIKKQAKESLERDLGIFKMAEAEGIIVADKDLDKRLSQIKQTLNKQTKSGFADMLKRQGKTEEQFKEELLKQLVSQELNKKLAKGIKVGDKEIEAFYNQNKNNFKHPTDTKKIRTLDEMKPLIKQILISQKTSEKMRKMLMKDRK